MWENQDKWNRKGTEERLETLNKHRLMLLSFPRKICMRKNWACRTPETGAAGAVDGFRIIRKAAEKASTPRTPGPCLQHSHSWGASINLLAWSNEHLWRFCSVECCLLCQKDPEAPQKLPRHISGACSPGIHFKNIPGEKSTQISGVVKS